MRYSKPVRLKTAPYRVEVNAVRLKTAPTGPDKFGIETEGRKDLFIFRIHYIWLMLRFGATEIRVRRKRPSLSSLTRGAAKGASQGG